MTRIVLNDSLSIIRAVLEVAPTRFNIRDFMFKVDSSPDVELWIWDGKAAKKTRQAIYPEYKAQRKPMAENIFEGLRLVKEAMLATKAIHVEVPGVEADDVIAALAKKYGSQKHHVHIKTRDLDLRALTVHGPHVTCSVEPKKGVLDEHLRLYKTFVGDPSDNIKGVKGFGEKAWEGIEHKAVLRNIIDNVNRGVPLSVGELTEYMSASSAQWIVDNRKVLLAMWVAVGFLPVDPLLIDRGTRVGKSDHAERDAKLGSFFL